MTPYDPPLINFGVLPVQTNTPLSPTADFAAVCGIWEVSTELHLEYHWSYYTRSFRHAAKDSMWVDNQFKTRDNVYKGITSAVHGGIQNQVHE